MMQCCFSVLPSRCNIYCAPKYIHMPYISLDSQRQMLSCNINHIIVDKDGGNRVSDFLYRSYIFCFIK